MKKKKSDSTELLPKKKRTLPEAARATMFGAPGRENPGRPKGSRNKFSEMFVRDFIESWEINGKAACQKAYEEDPVQYVKIAASIIPKDFNLNLNDENELDKLLEKFNIDELNEFLIGIRRLSASREEVCKGTSEKKVGGASDLVH